MHIMHLLNLLYESYLKAIHVAKYAVRFRILVLAWLLTGALRHITHLPSENPAVGAKLMNLAKLFLSFNISQGLSGWRLKF